MNMIMKIKKEHKMKIKAIVLAAAMLGSPAYAQSAVPVELCSTIATLAENIMTARQANIPLADMMAVVNVSDPDIQKIAIAVVLEAYKQPVMRSNNTREQAIDSFKNAVEITCYRAYND